MYFVMGFRIYFLFYVSFFFFKQKTAYEMRISDWSSDVCSSDLIYHPNDGMHLGLVPMIEDVVQRAARSRDSQKPGLGTRGSGLGKAEKPGIDDEIAIGRMLSAIEDGIYSEAEL